MIRRWSWLFIAVGLLMAVGFGASIPSAVPKSPRMSEESLCVLVCEIEPLGPTRAQCLAGPIAGLRILAAGVCVLTHGAGRFPGRVLWRRDGGLARVLWVALLLAGVALQAWMVLRFAAMRDPELLLWISALAPTLVVPLVALTGCYRARPALTSG